MGWGGLLLFFSFIPAFAMMFLTGDFGFLTGLGIWVSLGVAFAVGVGAGITVFSSGLQGESIKLAFVLSFATALYAILSYNIVDALSGMPYNLPAIIVGFSSIMFALGVFFIATGDI